VVWTLPEGFTTHAGYARYFLPAPPEGAAESPLDFIRTTATPPTLAGDPVRSETDDYYDAGVAWKHDALMIGVDGYWRQARNFLSDGAFGLGNIDAAFNYASARIRGVELTTTYAEGPVTAWANLAIAQAAGRSIISNQFYFTAAELAQVAARNTPLSHDETTTASAGASYRWGAFRIIADSVFGSGLPRTVPGGSVNGGHLPAYAQVNLALRYTLDTWRNAPLDLRLDILNLFDARYELRDGTGIGDGLPQWGPRRGVFVGFEQTF
jgi:outer membrane cobalamin receptor